MTLTFIQVTRAQHRIVKGSVCRQLSIDSVCHGHSVAGAPVSMSFPRVRRPAPPWWIVTSEGSLSTLQLMRAEL